MEWFCALQWIHIVLIVAILLVFACYSYLIVKVTRVEFVGGLFGKWRIRVFGILFGSLIVFYLVYNIYNIQPNEWVEISLLAGLVAATSALALVTLQQADLNRKTVVEMKEQRYDTVRPVIDIQQEADTTRQMGEQMSGASDLEAEGLSCKLKNIGVGPAIDLYSFVKNPLSHERQQKDFGTLAVDKATPTVIFSLEQDEGELSIVARYKDVYNRWLISKRGLTGEVGNWKLGSLKIRVL